MQGTNSTMKLMLLNSIRRLTCGSHSSPGVATSLSLKRAQLRLRSTATARHWPGASPGSKLRPRRARGSRKGPCHPLSKRADHHEQPTPRCTKSSCSCFGSFNCHSVWPFLSQHNAFATSLSQMRRAADYPLATSYRLCKSGAMGLIRLFLALVVAVDHWRINVLPPRSIFLDDVVKFGFDAGYAVMFFYVISGFLITYTLTRNYKSDWSGIRHSIATGSSASSLCTGRWSSWPSFCRFSLAQFLAASLPDQLTAIFLFGLDWRLAFGSYPTPY